MTTGVFREFFYNERLDFKSLQNDTIVVFDTNTLLNIYRYSNDTRNKLISAIKRIQSFIWMPYQVGLEFNLNRRNVISKLHMEKEQRIQEIKDLMNDSIKQLSQSVSKVSLKSTDANSRKKEIVDFINKKTTEFENELQKEIDSLYEMLDLGEDLASEIATIFDGSIGDCYTQELLDSKLKDAKERYENKIPPGFKDSNKNDILNYNGVKFEKKYGDLIVWHQILDKASDEKIKKVVLITDDNKEDWWYISAGKTIGPRAELKNEMLRVANADLYMLNANSFLNNMASTEDVKDLISTENYLIEREENIKPSWSKIVDNVKGYRIPNTEEKERNRVIKESSIYQNGTNILGNYNFNNDAYLEIRAINRKIRNLKENQNSLKHDINKYTDTLSRLPEDHPEREFMDEYVRNLMRERINLDLLIEDYKIQRDNLMNQFTES